MSFSTKQTPKFRFVLWLLILGVLGDMFLFLALSGFVRLPGYANFSHNTSTPIQLAAIQLTLTTPTPFQPLPTHTPTLTPTATVTPTPTPTRTPRPTATPTQTDTPVPEATSDGLPDSYTISGIYGYDQSHRLSCESRSAVDWARFFGVDIDEDTFLYALPTSDDPDSGFVGSPDGMEGQLPPNSYGVHAPPVAALLQQYGLNAAPVSGYSYEELRRQIASDHPVILWVFGDVWWGGTSVQYTATNGHTSTVIAYEHTVILVGYDADNVIILDGATTYYRSLAQFESSWATLGNMAVIMQ